MKALVLVGLAVATAHADPKAKAPHGATTISLDYTWQSFSSDEWHGKITWNGSSFMAGKKKVDPALIDHLYAGVTTNVKDSTEEMRCISHTDDYPKFVIKVEGDEPFTLSSESNCHAYVPWNIEKTGKRLVQFTGDAWKGLAPLLAAVDDRWKKMGNEPMASTSFGYEAVMLGSYSQSGKSTGDAGKCAQSIATNPQAKMLFGDGIVVSELTLACNLTESADCSAATAGAKLDWQGLDAELEIPCTGGVASFPAPLIESITELKTFLASKPVRLAVKYAKTHPRVYFNNAWSIEARGEGLPMIDWTPKTKVIHLVTYAETPHPSFWKDLGVDPKPFIKKKDGFAILEVTLDFAGKVVK